MRIDGSPSSSPADWLLVEPAAPSARPVPGPAALHGAPPATRGAQDAGSGAARQGATLAAQAMALDPAAGQARRRDIERFDRVVGQVCSDLSSLGAVDKSARGPDGDVPARHVDVRV